MNALWRPEPWRSAEFVVAIDVVIPKLKRCGEPSPTDVDSLREGDKLIVLIAGGRDMAVRSVLRGHSEMGSRHHGMVEFGVQIPMAPFDSLRSLMAGQPIDCDAIEEWDSPLNWGSSKSNALSERSESNG